MPNTPRRPEPVDQLLTVAEVADRLRLDPYTIRRWIGRGQLPAVRVGQQLRVRADELRRYLDGQAVTVLDDRAAR